jgi:signal transduction histidine kinase
VAKLLTFARHQPAAIHPVELPRLLDEALALLATSLRDSRIEVIRDLPAELPLVPADPAGLVQVLVNLITNAMHAMPTGGRLTVSASADKEHVTLALADTGIGIAPEHLGRVFDPFFTTKQVGKGTGLGLSVSYGIVREHGGRITVESEPGRGSTFRIVMPLAAESNPGAPPEAPVKLDSERPDRG